MYWELISALNSIGAGGGGTGAASGLSVRRIITSYSPGFQRCEAGVPLWRYTQIENHHFQNESVISAPGIRSRSTLEPVSSTQARRSIENIILPAAPENMELGAPTSWAHPLQFPRGSKSRLFPVRLYAALSPKAKTWREYGNLGPV